MGPTHDDDEDVGAVQLGALEDKSSPPPPTKMKVQPPDHFPCCIVVRGGGALLLSRSVSGCRGRKLTNKVQFESTAIIFSIKT